MCNNLKYINTKSKEKTYKHSFKIKKGLSYETVGKMIDSFDRYYSYSSYRGILKAEFMIAENIYVRTSRLLIMSMPLVKNLTLKEFKNILIDVEFQYNAFNGMFSIIHKITYCKGDR